MLIIIILNKEIGANPLQQKKKYEEMKSVEEEKKVTHCLIRN